MTPHAVNEAVKRLARRVKLDVAGDVTSHGLRAGAPTDFGRLRYSAGEIKEITNDWSSTEQVEKYRKIDRRRSGKKADDRRSKVITELQQLRPEADPAETGARLRFAAAARAHGPAIARRKRGGTFTVAPPPPVREREEVLAQPHEPQGPVQRGAPPPPRRSPRWQRGGGRPAGCSQHASDGPLQRRPLGSEEWGALPPSRPPGRP
ncbi:MULTISPECIES: hypothetical protein [unclassified Streptomyces]|uniref:hypothetical protein n=1 Tax=unclassified Streptomyces TaxID=2593676 RepID=UPI00339A2AB6